MPILWGSSRSALVGWWRRPLDSRIVLKVFLMVAVLAIFLLVWLTRYRKNAPLSQAVKALR